MNRNPDHSVQRIVLPSGRTVEVVRFNAGADRARHQLHRCPQCGCHLVQPVTWRETRASLWALTLECPNCWWSDEDVFDRDQVDDLEERLDQGLAEMLDVLGRLTKANMAQQIESFAAALHADLILPEDF